MKVFITDLEAYNNGLLVGNWYTLPMDEDLLAESIEDVLNLGRKALKSEHYHEEYFITDFECEYMDIEEYEDLAKLNGIAETMEALEDTEKTAVSLLLENGVVNDLDEAIEKKDDIFCTGETSMEDVAYNYIEETGALKDMGNLSFYFDYEKLGRDMDIEGSYYEDDEGVIWECVA